MEPYVVFGKIVEMDIPELEKKMPHLGLEMPRKPEDASMSFYMDSIFHKFLGKTVKITVEEIAE